MVSWIQKMPDERLHLHKNSRGHAQKCQSKKLSSSSRTDGRNKELVTLCFSHTYWRRHWILAEILDWSKWNGSWLKRRAVITNSLKYSDRAVACSPRLKFNCQASLVSMEICRPLRYLLLPCETGMTTFFSCWIWENEIARSLKYSMGQKQPYKKKNNMHWKQKTLKMFMEMRGLYPWDRAVIQKG